MENHGILLEQTMVAALTRLDGLSDRVCPVIDIRKNNGPLVVYDQKTENQEQELSGDSGLQAAAFQIHVLHGTYRTMRLLSENVKSALKSLRGIRNGPLLIEAVILELATPDILEGNVQLFRRTYNVNFYYQIKEE